MHVKPSLTEPAVSVAEFITTMPDRYRNRFDWIAARHHARIAAARESHSANAGTFETAGETVLCVVAPDAPGVLAAISAGLVVTGFDIQRAEAYTRKPRRSAPEAVDFFWICREGSASIHSPSKEEVHSILSTLTELLEDGGALSRERVRVGRTAGAAETIVRFLDQSTRDWLTLQVETGDRKGLLLSVCAALFAEGVQIVGSRIQTNGPRASDHFDLLERDGSQICGTRLQRIKLAVLAAVDDL